MPENVKSGPVYLTGQEISGGNLSPALWGLRINDSGGCGKSATKGRNRSGRKCADRKTREHEAKIAAAWNKARDTRQVCKVDFAEDNEMTQKDRDRLLDRVRSRKSHSE